MGSGKASEALSVFHPLVADWFERRIGEPTLVQERAWQRIAAGDNVLVTAPTGSGKTLAAFLWSLNQLLTGGWSGGQTKVLYVSPLRALNNDIQRNLLGPLAELRREFEEAGEQPAAVRVQTRSGDTPAAQRQSMLRQPPEVLITTPESFNILLTSKGGRNLLGAVECVILDEIHAVAGSKRGTHLITAVERLGLLAGEFQRVALSATVRPAECIAGFVAGFRAVELGADGEPVGRQRPITVIASPEQKRYELTVVAPRGQRSTGEPLDPDAEMLRVEPTPAEIWDLLVEGIGRRIRSNRSTLIFANSRRLTEKLTRFLNESAATELVYSHHGSLSREIRAVVEERLKQGRLAALVATNSLELGIDIGALDEVLLVETPATVASAVQRLGRAGHQVGVPSRGRLYPLFARDLLDAAVMARCVLEQEIEESRPVTGALDVLAQVILSMVVAEVWKVDELYAFLRSTYPYRELKRRQFDLVVEMLAGRYADSRIRELLPRVTLDRLDNTIRARPGAARLLYQSGGTIPDRGYFHLRLQESMAKIGELDEEFVWERSVGDTFTLGAQSWQIRSITHNDVLVVPARRTAAMAPFWRAEERSRSFHLASRTGEFLEQAEAVLRHSDGRSTLVRRLREEHGLDAPAAEELVGLLEMQRSVTGCALPHRHHLVVERVTNPDPREGRSGLVLHTLWGGRVNRPWALALAAAWESREGRPLAVEQDNDCLLFSSDEHLQAELLFELVRPDNVEDLLRFSLEKSGFFGARFRENAGRALLLPRASFRRRVPLWLNRQRAKRMLTAVSRYQDFPVLVETWRTCLQDEFDLESLKLVLGELERGEIAWSEVSTSQASPLAKEVLWRQTNLLMYEDDVPEDARQPGLRRELLQELVYSSQLRPRLPAALVERFRRKLHRLDPGYAPQTAADLLDWTRERVVLPLAEWQELVAAVERDLVGSEESLDALLQEASQRLLRVRGSDDNLEELDVVTHVEDLPRLARALGWQRQAVELQPMLADSAGSEAALRWLERHWGTVLAEADSEIDSAESGITPVDLVGEWIRFYGPVPESFVRATFALTETDGREAVESLLEQERIVIDRFRSEDAERLEICDCDNLEHLLRLLRADARPSFEARPLEELPLLLAVQQGLGDAGGDPEPLKSALEGLFGYPAPARLWESELLPARLEPYYTAWLDALVQESDLVWFGCGRERLSLALRPELELFRVPAARDDQRSGEDLVEEVFSGRQGRCGFEELLRDSSFDAGRLSEALWSLAWEGRVSNTTFLAVRQAALSQFREAEPATAVGGRARGSGRSRRSRIQRWQAVGSVPGDWYRLDSPDEAETEPDALEVEELNRERIRQLLERYGILFRELLGRELPALRWPKLFRTLRILELSGEVLAGHFFRGIPGLQFISPAAFRSLREGLPADRIFWMGALDPASPCGLSLEEFKGSLPPRRPGTHLVYHGTSLVVVARRQGRHLEIRVEPDHPYLRHYLGFLKVLLTRQFDPLHGVAVETINGEPAPNSRYAELLAEMFAVSREPGALKLRRRY